MIALADFGPVWLTFKLAAIVTILLLLIGTPLAWWLANSRSRFKVVIEAITALPLVLPPTVLGFYLLILLNPDAPLGAFWVSVTGQQLTFSFTGLVIASVIYSLPFMVQPLQNAFQSIDRSMMDAASSLGAGPVDAFFNVAFPLSKRGFLTACVLTFAHTVGEFGVVLMVGGNIPDRTKVLSIAIYEHVETLRYAEAHMLSALLLGFSFIVLFITYAANKKAPIHVG